MTDREKQDLIDVFDHYKEQIYGKLLELAAERVQGIAPERLEPPNLPETLALLYMQGVAEALDAVSPAEVVKAMTDEGTDSFGGSIEA